MSVFKQALGALALASGFVAYADETVQIEAQTVVYRCTSNGRQQQCERPTLPADMTRTLTLAERQDGNGQRYLSGFWIQDDRSLKSAIRIDKFFTQDGGHYYQIQGGTTLSGSNGFNHVVSDLVVEMGQLDALVLQGDARALDANTTAYSLFVFGNYRARAAAQARVNAAVRARELGGL